MKFIKALLTLFWSAVSLGLVYFFWTGVLPERMAGTTSESGMELQLRMTGTRGLDVTYKTTLVLTTLEGERFVYDLDTLGSRDAVAELVRSMIWEDGDTLSFENQPKQKHVTISYADGLWDLTEQKL
jgi:hypothetical protein